jgi:putative component of membrane protein insertase Oxa1/YidC/SpoIIIJ protein YidD
LQEKDDADEKDDKTKMMQKMLQSARYSSKAFWIGFFLVAFSQNVLFGEVGYVEPWGKDAEMVVKKEQIGKAFQEKPSLLTRIADSVIRFHQEIISPIDGPRSHYRPSSSRYMQLAMSRYGFVKGYVMGCDRLLRENDEKWVYQKTFDGEFSYKFDPAIAR